MKTLKPLWLCIILFIIVEGKPCAIAQTTIYSTSFGATANVNPPGWTFTGLNMNISTHSPRSAGYIGASGQCYLAEGNSADFINTSGTLLSNSQPGISTATLLVNTSGYSAVTISFGMRKSAGYNNDVVYSLEWSNNGITYTSVTFTEPSAGGWGLASGSGLNLPAGAGNQPTLYLKWTFNRTGPNYGLNFRMDDFSVTGTGIACTPPSITSVSNNSPVCEGSTVNFSLAATGSPTLSYLWSGPNGFVSTSEDPSISNATVAATGTYTVTVTNSCGSASATTSVTVNPPPAVGVNASATSVCTGTSVILTGTSAVSYSWSGGVNDGVPFTPSATTTYIVTGTDANSCTATASVTITVNQLPNVGVNATATTVCAGTSVTLTGTGAVSYSWSGGISNGVPFTPSSTTTYTVTGTDGNGCAAMASISITVNTLPSVSTNITSAALCAGDSITLSGTGAASYSWSDGVVNGIPFTPPTTTTTYTVTGTDGNSCTATASVPVTVNPLPTVGTNATATTVCSGTPVTLTGTGAVASFSWSGGASNGIPFIPSSTATYTVTGTDANGCTSTASVIITVNPLPPAPLITAGGDTTFCQGDSVILTASAATNYLWSTNETTQSITVDTTGNYSVTAMDTNGCAASSILAISVTVLPLPSTDILADGPTSFCPGGSVTLTAGVAASYLWSTGDTTQSIFVDTTGNYSVTVTGINGCTNTSSSPVAVTIIADPTDINRDGITNNTDFLLLLGQFNNNCTSCDEDINEDGVVNNVDFLILLARFNMPCE